MKHLRPLSACAVALFLLTGCGASDVVVQPSTQQSASAGPNLDAERIQAALTEIQATVDQADQTMDSTLLTSRVANPALQMRTDQYTVAKATSAAVPALALAAQKVTVTNSEQWPRAVVNVTESPDGKLPVVAFYVQETPRSQYKLQNWARVLGGSTLAFSALEKGSAFLEENATGYVKTPKEALEAYVGMLNSGTAGNDLFTADEFARIYLQDVKTLNDAVHAAGNVTAHAEINSAYPLAGVATEDGSALVAASFTYTLTYQRTVARSTMRLGGTTAAVSEGNDDTVKGKATATYVATVLLNIPAADRGGAISVVGAERTLGSVVKDDAAGNPDSAR